MDVPMRARRGSMMAVLVLAAALMLSTPVTLAATAPSKDRIPVGGLALFLMGTGALLLFALSLLAARKARKPKEYHPPRRSFERGRELGLQAGVASEQDAVRALAATPVGKLVSVAPVPQGYRISLSRKRSEPCDVAAGFVTGLFEAAWARDVILRHEACQGKARNAVCTYEVRDPSPRGLNRRDAPAAGAGTPRSGDAPRRWPPARPGGA